MPLSKNKVKDLTLSDSPSQTFQSTDGIIIVKCEKLKCDTTIHIETSLDKETWVAFRDTKDRLLTVPPTLYYRATVLNGQRQVEPISLQFNGEIANDAKTKKETKPVAKGPVKAPQRPTKPLASGVQLRHSPPRNNPSGSSNTTGKA